MSNQQYEQHEIKCNTPSLRGDMNESKSHLNERKVKKDLKELKLPRIPTICTFLFSGLTIETPNFSVLSSKQLYVV